MQEKKPLAETLMFGAVALVPFQQALTINVGFPLKASEILGIIAVAMLMVESRPAGFKVTNRAAMLAMGIIVTLSTVVNIFTPLPVMSYQGYERGFTFDIIQYSMYAFLVLIIGWFAATRLGPERIGKATSVGIKLAAAYSLLQLALHFAGSAKLLEALNGTTQLGRSYGESITRNGPFLEGNYLGFFAGLALFIAAKRRDKPGVAAALFCLVYSQSTTGIISVLLAVLVLVVVRPRGKAVALFGGMTATVVAVGAFTPAAQTFLQTQALKLGFGSPGSQIIQGIDTSRRDRGASLETGFAIGADNPLLGVGPGRYGVWFDQYLNVDSPLGKFIGSRPIANNAYAQIVSELGFIALGAVVLMLIVIFFHVRRGGDSKDIALVVFVAIGLNAVPAWTVLPIWFVIAYLAGAAREAEDNPIKIIKPETRYRPLNVAPHYARLAAKIERQKANAS